MNSKKRSASRCTARSQPAVSSRAVVVLPAPGGPVRMRIGSDYCLPLLVPPPPPPPPVGGAGAGGGGGVGRGGGRAACVGRLAAAGAAGVGGLVADVAGRLVLDLGLVLGRLGGF